MNLDTVVDEYKDRIYRIVYMYAFNTEEHTEIYQQILINLWKSLPKFEGRSTLSTWIYRVCINTCKMYRRSKFYERSTIMFDESITNEPEQEQSLIANEQIDILYRCLGKLTDQNRLIMTLYLDELSYEEIAEIIGISVNLVGVRISRAKEKMKSCLIENGINYG